jgi:hypothetical protein
VAEMEKEKDGSSLTSRLINVLLPAPEGAENMTTLPSFISKSM